MSEDKNKDLQKQTHLKGFFIKLISISIAFVIVINLIFNLIFSERLEKFDKILLLDKSEFRNEIKDKLRSELEDGLNKENMINKEDKILLYKIYLKLKQEFETLDKSQF
tara:strand:+ start:29 stop:355 length:327 start_codon:yes stop_codon:yes gene_type:complete